MAKHQCRAYVIVACIICKISVNLGAPIPLIRILPHHAMPTYAQTKIKDNGVAGNTFNFDANSMDDAVQIVKDVIPTKRSFYNAVAFVITNVDGDESPVTLTRGTDF